MLGKERMPKGEFKLLDNGTYFCVSFEKFEEFNVFLSIPMASEVLRGVQTQTM